MGHAAMSRAMQLCTLAHRNFKRDQSITRAVLDHIQDARHGEPYSTALSFSNAISRLFFQFTHDTDRRFELKSTEFKKKDANSSPNTKHGPPPCRRQMGLANLETCRDAGEKKVLSCAKIQCQSDWYVDTELTFPM